MSTPNKIETPTTEVTVENVTQKTSLTSKIGDKTVSAMVSGNGSTLLFLVRKDFAVLGDILKVGNTLFSVHYVSKDGHIMSGEVDALNAIEYIEDRNGRPRN